MRTRRFPDGSSAAGPRRQRIPSERWQMAVAVARVQGIPPTVTALNLNYYDLPRRLPSGAARQGVRAVPPLGERGTTAVEKSGRTRPRSAGSPRVASAPTAAARRSCVTCAFVAATTGREDRLASRTLADATRFQPVPDFSRRQSQQPQQKGMGE